jgi:hypothetical protein
MSIEPKEMAAKPCKSHPSLHILFRISGGMRRMVMSENGEFNRENKTRYVHEIVKSIT